MLHKVLNVIFPERCIICDNVMNATENQVAICPRCADELIFLDEVAYVRFVSVYRQFKDVATFMEELERLTKTLPKKIIMHSPMCVRK